MAGGFTFAGKLETTSFPEIAGAVYRLGKSGELKVSMGDRSRTVWFLDGNPVAVTSVDPRDHLARVLEESGKISAEEAGRLEGIAEEKEALQKVDFISRELLTWGLKSRFVQLCYDIFRWTEGEYRFQEATPPRNLPLLKVPTPTMILKGVAYLPPAYLRRRVSEKGILEPGAVPPEEATYLSMEEKIFLEACRDGGAGGDAAKAMAVSEEARRRIFAFISLGLLSLRMPIQEEGEEEAPPPEPAVLELGEESIIPDATFAASPAIVPPAPAGAPAPTPLPLRSLDDEEEFGEQTIPPVPPIAAQPLQGELPYKGFGVTIPPPAMKRRSVFLPLQRRGLWLVIAGFGVVLIVALWRIFALLTTPSPTPEIPLTRVFPTPRPTVTVIGVSVTPTTDGGAPAVMTPVPSAVAATPAAVVAAATPRAAATSVPAAAAQPPSSPPAVSPGPGVDRYREGLDVYRTGDIRKAAEVWAALLPGGRADAYTIQIEVACSLDTVTADFPALERLGEAFVLPRNLKGRSCYAVCLGRFPSKAGAEEALLKLPSSYAREGATVKALKALAGQ